jgi:hypothetical protein
MVAGIGVDAPETWIWVDLTTGEQKPLPELDGYELSRTSLDDNRARPIDRIAQFNEPSDEDPTVARGVDMATGKVSGTLEHPVNEDIEWIVMSDMVHDGYLVAQDLTGSFTVLSPATDTKVELGFPPEAERLARSNYLQRVLLSPSGSCLVLTIQTDGDSASYVTPIQPGGAWTELPYVITDWVAASDAAEIQTLPAQDFATPQALQEDGEYETSISVTAKDDIYVSIIVDGVEVYDRELAEDDTAGPFTGAEFEVLTTSGVDTLFTTSCNDHPFNMGHENREAYYILKADAASCPPEATPSASPAASPSCDVTAPNGEVPPEENADLAWLGSGSDDPSLWLMMTWDDGTIATNRIADGYPVMLSFWRGDGIG